MRCPKCHTDNPETQRFCGECGTKLDISGKTSAAELPPQIHKDQVSVTKTLETGSDELHRGAIFAGRYEIIEELGVGGMGRVYRAFDRKIEEEVALKLIHPEIAADKRTIKRFRNEIKTARKITHKNVCRTHDLGEDGRALFITMEYVRGEDLKSLMRRTKILADSTAVSIARQVAEGLMEAHRTGIVHRDLKPGNIMIDKEGNAKIMDFGIARSLASEGTTAEGAIIGTPEYMSPEQVEGHPADQRADIYALGVILFEMVTGRPLFEGETSLAIAYKHRYEPAPDPQMLNPQLPRELGRLIIHCLEKEKEKRYQTAAEVRTDLDKIERQVSSTERIAPSKKLFASKEITVKLIPKKLLIPALALIVVVAISAIFLMKDRSNRKKLPPFSKNSIAVLPFTDLSQEKDQAAWCEGIAETILYSLANVRNLQVRGRHSSFQFTVEDDPREVGKKLNVDKLLTGSLWKFGDRLRVTVRLINPATGIPDWSHQEDGEMGEIFDMQDRIVVTLISRMKVEILGEDRERLEKRYTNDWEAYDLYLKGNYALNKGNDVDALKAVSLYLGAIQKDPNFVLAHIALARCYQDLTISYGVWPKEKSYDLTKEALNTTFALDNENGEAFAIRAGFKYFFENDPAGAELDYQRAFQLSPRNAMILRDRFRYLTTRGFLLKAESEAKLLIEIDPMDPYGYWMLGLINYNLRRYDDSIDAYQKALEIDPDFVNAQGWSVFTYLAQGQYEKAREAAARFAHEIQDQYLFSMAIIEGSLGNKEAAEKYKEALDKFVLERYSMPTPPYWEAAYSAVMGDRDETLDNLTKLLSENQYGPVNDLFYWHYYDKYRSDPEFIALFKKAGFEME